MNIKIAVWFASRSFWQRNKQKAPKHLMGAVIGIGLSLIPLLVVLVVANGMIEGITRRLIEVFTYHLQVQLDVTPRSPQEALEKIAALETVLQAHMEKSGFGLVRAHYNSSGTRIKALSPDVLVKDTGFRENLNLTAGAFSLESPPQAVAADLFETTILDKAGQTGDRQVLTACYEKDETRGVYLLKAQVVPGDREILTALFSGLKYTGALIGEALAEKLGVGLGDTFFLLSVKGSSKVMPKFTRLIVTGIFTTGYQDVDKYILYIPYESGRQILSGENSNEYIGIKVKDPYGALDTTIIAIKSILKQYNISYSYVETWEQMQWTQYQSFKSTKISLIIIICLIIVVAAANVFSAINMLVMSKTREIAILKSMGSDPGTITLSFLLTGFLTGLTGTIAGIIVGLFLAVNINEIMVFIEQIINGVLAIFSNNPVNIAPVKILNPDYYLEKIPINISLVQVFFVACFSICISTLASLFPALNAGNVRPLEIIRKY